MKDLFKDYAEGIDLEKARIRELRIKGLHRQAESAQRRAVDLESALLERDIALFEDSRMKWTKKLPFTKRLTPWGAVSTYVLAFGFVFAGLILFWGK